MNTAQEHNFRTKNGTCTITPEQIILKRRKGILGDATKRICVNNMKRYLTIYAIICVLCFGQAAWLLVDRNYFWGTAFCVLGIFLLWNIVYSRNNSAAPVIDRNTIKSVVAHPPHFPLTRGFFAIHFLENGNDRKRLIFLPGSLSGGEQEYQRALLVMQETGLLSRI